MSAPSDEAGPRERRLRASGIAIAGREWGPADGVPVLALHGWLDNAGSFDPLAAHLPACRLLALDAAGHGFSDFRSEDSGYNLWQDVGDLVEIADRLGWHRFSFIGHSRGAAIGTLLAGTCPERVDRLVLIEGGLPLVGQAADAPRTLAEALERKRELLGRGGRVFPDRATAIAERANGFSRVSVEAAEILARRSLRTVESGYAWHADQRLKAPSEIRLTAELARAFVERVSAPVLMFRASRSPFRELPEYREIVPAFRSIEVVELDGDHHLHMEGAEVEIGARVRRFLGLA